MLHGHPHLLVAGIFSRTICVVTTTRPPTRASYIPCCRCVLGRQHTQIAKIVKNLRDKKPPVSKALNKRGKALIKKWKRVLRAPAFPRSHSCAAQHTAAMVCVCVCVCSCSAIAWLETTCVPGSGRERYGSEGREGGEGEGERERARARARVRGGGRDEGLTTSICNNLVRVRALQLCVLVCSADTRTCAGVSARAYAPHTRPGCSQRSTKRPISKPRGRMSAPTHQRVDLSC